MEEELRKSLAMESGVRCGDYEVHEDFGLDMRKVKKIVTG